MKNLHTIEEAIEILRNGGVGVMPTDTVYGIVARAADEAAVARLYAAKDRKHKPGTVIAANAQQLVELGIPKRYISAVEHLWPNSLSIEIPLGNRLPYLHQDTGRQAYRVVADENIRAILERTGPLVTSSANQPGEPGATTIQQAYDYFEDEVDFYVDGGDLSGKAPSTIIKIVDDAIEIIRQGAVVIDETGKITSKQGCPFCQSNLLLKSEVLTRFHDGFAIKSNSHTDSYLIIPSEHVEQITDLPDTWWHTFKELYKKLPEKPEAYNIAMNYGKLAGQSVKHLHFWIIPRTAGKPSSGKGLARFIEDADKS